MEQFLELISPFLMMLLLTNYFLIISILGGKQRSDTLEHIKAVMDPGPLTHKREKKVPL
jgi:hypothetical protein